MRREPSATAVSEEQFHAISRALADPRRFAILEQIAADTGMGCSALEEQQIISPATISHHLKELQEAGLIEVKREGRGSNLFFNRTVYRSYLERLATL
jgi:ArsR family transcriptional regulator, arsenate/arsenite/antimonite-responsive transcriptional repressor